MTRILVTGAAGFVGGFVTRSLLESGAEVVALALEPNPRLPVEQISCDLLEPDALLRVPRAFDGVIHLAGDTVPRALEGPARVQRNARMLLNLLDRVHAPRIVVASSAHVYARSDAAHEEAEPLAPRGWYGLSKRLLEDVAVFFQSRGRVDIVRGFNQIGPDMHPDLLVPAILRKLDELASGDPTAPLVLAGFDSVRDFVDVRDAARAYVGLLEREAPTSGTFNVCSGRPTRVRELARAIMTARGERRRVVFESRQGSEDDVPVLVGSCAAVEQEIGWRATTTLAESARHIIAGEGT